MSTKGYFLAVAFSGICLSAFAFTGELWQAVATVWIVLCGILLNGVKYDSQD